MTIQEARARLKFAVKVIRIIRHQQQHGPQPVSEQWRAKADKAIRECRALLKVVEQARKQKAAA